MVKCKYRLGLIVLMACWQLGQHASAQSSSPPPFENLSIDRPDVSNLPTTVRPGHYQFEMGVEFENAVDTREFSAPNMVFRTGITNKSELRIGLNRLYLDSIRSGLSDDVIFASISGKYRFVEEDGWRPAVAVQPEFSLPFGDGAYIHHDHPNYALADYSIILLFNNTLHQQLFINYNAGVFWSQNDRVDWLLSASASFLHTHRLGYFLELFTLVENNQFPLSFDGGLMFLAAPRLQFDAYLGYRALEEEAAWYGGLGIGFRLDRGDLSQKTFGDIGIHH